MKVSEIAKITVAGEVIEGSDIETVGFLTHTAALRMAREQGEQVVIEDGESGLLFQGSMRSVLLSLWPERWRQDYEEFSAWARPIYKHLRENGNAIYLGGGKADPHWWIAQEFHSENSNAEKGSNVSTAVENPVEAVETIKVKSVKKRKASKKYVMSKGDPRDLILALLLEVDRPMYLREFQAIRESGRLEDVPSEWTVRRVIDSLVKDGLVVSRDNPAGTRPKRLYAHADYQGSWIFTYQRTPGEKSEQVAIEPIALTVAVEPEQPVAVEPRTDLVTLLEQRVEKIVEQRIAAVVAERDALAAELAAVQKFLDGLE